MKKLSREDRIYVLEPGNPPAITIDSGEELMVETWDAFEGVRDAKALDEKQLKGPASGPIYVNGAEPGDALRVDFISVRPKAEEGAAHMVLPGRGFLAGEFTEAYPTVMTIEGMVTWRCPPATGYLSTLPWDWWPPRPPTPS